MVEKIFGGAVFLLWMLLIIRTIYNNHCIKKSYITKYGRPLYIFQRILAVGEDFDMWRHLYVYPNFIITKYNGEDLIIPRGTLAETSKHALLWSFFCRVLFKIIKDAKEYKIVVNSPRAVKILEKFFSVI